MGAKEDRRAYWDKVISEQRASGKSASEFCRGRGISDSSFSTWVTKLKSLNAEPKFAQVVRDNKIELELSGGMKVRVNKSDLKIVLSSLCEQ